MTEPPLDPLRHLREEFRSAASRRIAVEGRARRRRGALAAVAAIVATGGVAAATQLISTGTPTKETPRKPPNSRYAPAKLGQLAVTADDPGFALPWGLVIYSAKGGEQCALVGQARGSDLGLITDGVFHPYERRTGGACGDIGHVPYFLDFRFLKDRTLLYGRTRRDAARVRLQVPGEPTRSAATGPGGAFLFVFNGRLGAAGMRFVALDRDGKRLG
jgi:hypothetical protein